MPVGHLRALAAAAFVLCAGATASAQPTAVARVRYSIDDGWRFMRGGGDRVWSSAAPDESWERVSLPHTWNAHDPFDDVPGYYRGPGWYRRTLHLDGALKEKRVFLYFEGANQRAVVYVNGAFAGEHRGGYTAFALDVTKLLKFDGKENENLVAVMVDNSHDPFIPPLSVGYALYGGLYRDAWLIATDPVHLDVTDHASPGVFVSTPAVSRERGDVLVRGTVVNDGGSAKRLRIVNTVTDAAGAHVTRSSASLVVTAGAKAQFHQTLPTVRAPHLWSPSDPYLYAVTTDVYDGDRLVDRVTNPLGFRWYRFDPARGFLLNGEKVALHGTNRHQDLEGEGSALSNVQHVRDMELIKQMGANFVRLAHYPQDPAVLDAADRLGLLIWEEIPVVNYITPAGEFTANAEGMLRDMIRQHYNHPSVILWGIMNEALLYGGTGSRVAVHSDTAYVHSVRALAEALNATAHAEDSTRRTVMAIHESDDYDRWGIAGVTDVLGVNLYKGWYSGVFSDFGALLDARHRAHPEQVVIVSEYGAGSDERLNSLRPERFDFTGNWQRLYHETHLRQIDARPWLAGTAIWNEFDFSQPNKGYSLPNRNQKGMITWDRRPKDVYYLYKANWNDEPMVHVASHDWADRIGADSGTSGAASRVASQPVDVYSNLARVELVVNGRSLGAKAPDAVHKATWEVAFAPGENVVEARGERAGKTYADRVVIRFTTYPAVPGDTSFRELAVNVGTEAQFADGTSLPWTGDQPYRPGSFGHEGGTAQRTGAIITGTGQVPLFITYQDGLTGYRFDVPDGDYEVELLFAEPKETEPGKRVFGVAVNGQVVAERLDLAAEAGRGGAVRLATRAYAANGAGVRVAFTRITGAPILSAIRIRHVVAVAPVATATTSHAAGEARLELARGGVAKYVIVAERDASPAGSLAASELASYLSRMSGAQFRVRTEAGSSSAIVLRRAGATDGDLTGDAYAIRVRGDSLLLVGGSDRAVLYAAYDLLEQLGCEWLAPGFAFYRGAHEVVPRRDMLVYESAGDVVERPAIATRILDVGQAASYDTASLRQLVAWLPKLRFNTVRFPADHGGSGRVKWDNWRAAIAPELTRRGLSIEVGGHGYQNFLSARMEGGTIFGAHPDWFGRDSTCRRSRATNVVFNSANADATQFLLGKVAHYVAERPEIDVFDFWPPDGARWSECAADASLGTPQERQVTLANALAQELRRVRPAARLEIIAYADALLPPRQVTLDRDVIVDFCPIDQSFDAPIDDAETPNNARYAAALLEWRRAHPGQLGAYTYYRKYAWRSLPVLIPHYMQRDMRWYASVPVQRISTYGEPADWFTYELNYLAFGKLAWNPQIDVDSLVARYAEGRFGRARAVAAAALSTLENEYRPRGSIPFSASDTPEELHKAGISLASRLASLNAARAAVPGTAAASLDRLSLMLGIAQRDVRIQESRVRGGSPTAVAAQIDDLVRFIGAHADDGVFLSRGYEDDRGRYQRHYTRESVVVVRGGNEAQ